MEVLNSALAEYGFWGIVLSAVALFVWRGLWPWYKDEYWPARMRLRQEEATAFKRISDTNVAIGEVLRTMGGNMAMMEDGLGKLLQEFQHINIRLARIEFKLEVSPSPEAFVSPNIEVQKSNRRVDEVIDEVLAPNEEAADTA